MEREREREREEGSAVVCAWRSRRATLIWSGSCLKSLCIASQATDYINPQTSFQKLPRLTYVYITVTPWISNTMGQVAAKQLF